jgi:hypothetical protein
MGRDVQARPSLRALDMRLIPGLCLREILLGNSSLDAKLEALRLALEPEAPGGFSPVERLAAHAVS